MNPISLNAEVFPPLKQQFKQSNLFEMMAEMKEATYNSYTIFTCNQIFTTEGESGKMYTVLKM